MAVDIIKCDCLIAVGISGDYPGENPRIARLSKSTLSPEVDWVKSSGGSWLSYVRICLVCKIKEDTDSQGCAGTNPQNECLFNGEAYTTARLEAARRENILIYRNL